MICANRKGSGAAERQEVGRYEELVGGVLGWHAMPKRRCSDGALSSEMAASSSAIHRSVAAELPSKVGQQRRRFLAPRRLLVEVSRCAFHPPQATCTTHAILGSIWGGCWAAFRLPKGVRTSIKLMFSAHRKQTKIYCMFFHLVTFL